MNRTWVYFLKGNHGKTKIVVDRQSSMEGAFWSGFTVHDRCVCCSAVAFSESADYHLIPSGHCLGVLVASDVWFALLYFCCRVVLFLLMLLLIFPFYPLCEVLRRILLGALYSLVQSFLAAVSAFSLLVIPTCLGTQSNVIVPPC
jgi:hypothetical protein